MHKMEEVIQLLGHQLYSQNYSDKPISTEFSHQRHSEICIDSCAAVGVLQIFYDGANIVSLYSLGAPSVSYIINYRFLTTETNLKTLYIFHCLFTTSSVKLFVVNVQIFVYNCVFWKKEKQHSQNLSHFENESTFRKRTPF